MFATRKVPEVSVGRVYILELTLDDMEVVYKIGMCHAPRSADRMMEVLRSWFMAYRYVPFTRSRLDFETGVPYLLEQHLHELLAEWKWVPEKKTDGHTELFKDIDVDEVIDYIKNIDYSLLLPKGSKSISTEDYNYILSKSAVEFKDEDIPY